MSGSALLRQNCRVHTSAVVAHTQAESLMVVPDFHLDLARMRMAERIPQALRRDSVDFVAQDGVQVSRLARHGDAKSRGPMVAGIGGEFLSQGIDGPRQVVGLDRRFA